MFKLGSNKFQLLMKKITGIIMIRVAKDILGESQGGAPLCKDTSQWNKEVKVTIKIKRDSYRDLKKNCDGVSFEKASQEGG